MTEKFERELLMSKTTPIAELMELFEDLREEYEEGEDFILHVFKGEVAPHTITILDRDILLHPKGLRLLSWSNEDEN